MVSMAGTVVLVTAVAATKMREGQDFFPLTVDYVEKFYSAGRIPGGFFKREGRPTEKETLTSRLIDRPVRPLFPEEFKNEVQVIAQVVSLNPGSRRRHPGAARCIRGAEPGRHPVQGSDRRRARRLRQRQVPAESDIDRVEDVRSRSRRRRHHQRRADGRIRSQAAQRRRHARCGHVRSSRDADGDPRDRRTRHRSGQAVVGLAAAGARRIAGRRAQGRGRQQARRSVPGARQAAASRCDFRDQGRRTGFAQGRSRAEGLAGAPIWPRNSPSSNTARCATACSRPRCASTGVSSTTSVRSRCVSACCRARTVRRCSRAAKRRRWSRSRSAPRAIRRSSMRRKASRRIRSCSTTTSRRSRSAKPAASARRSVAKSATVASPSAA